MTIDLQKWFVFFDGDCSFCNFWVQWILKRDKKDSFMFSSLQSEFGQAFLKERNLDLQSFNTLILWKPNQYYLIKAPAVFEIMKILGGKYSFLAYFRIIPHFLSNPIYDLIAKNRFHLQKNNCPLPTPEQRKKIIS